MVGYTLSYMTYMYTVYDIGSPYCLDNVCLRCVCVRVCVCACVYTLHCSVIRYSGVLSLYRMLTLLIPAPSPPWYVIGNVISIYLLSVQTEFKYHILFDIDIYIYTIYIYTICVVHNVYVCITRVYIVYSCV